jgi:hypothetical protein
MMILKDGLAPSLKTQSCITGLLVVWEFCTEKKINCELQSNLDPFPYEANWQLVTGNGSITLF